MTGANSGIGLETSVLLARAGATVVLGCRDPSRGEAAVARVSERAGGARVSLLHLDLADLSSVRAAAGSVGELDILVNNAGVMAVRRGTTADGFETQLGVDHLGHFALTGLLLRSLLARPGARVVTVSSLFASLGRLRAEDFYGQRRYLRWLAYGGAKLANLLFAAELDRRARAAGADLVSVAAHPGYASTSLLANGVLKDGPRWLAGLVDGVAGRMGQPADLGALPTVYAACVPGVAGGQYFGPGGPFQLRGHPRPASPPLAARDRALASRVWDASVRATGVSFAELSPPRLRPEGVAAEGRRQGPADRPRPANPGRGARPTSG